MFSDPQAQHAQHAQHAAGQAVNVYQAAPSHLAGVPYPYSPAPASAGQLPVAQYAYIQVPFPAANCFSIACCFLVLIGRPRWTTRGYCHNLSFSV